MTAAAGLFLIQFLGFVGFLWLGLYVFARGERDRASRLAGFTALSTSCLFLTSDIAATIHPVNPGLQVAFLRGMWWTSVLPAVLWLHLSLRLGPRIVQRSWHRSLIPLAYTSAALIIVLGTGTNLIRMYAADGRGSADNGPLYPVYVMFLLACAGIAVLNLVHMHAPSESIPNHAADRTATPSRVVAGSSVGASSAAHSIAVYGSAARLLLIGAACFLGAVVYFVLLTLSHQATPMREGPVWVLLLIGMAAVGGTVGIQSNLLLGRDVRRDFLYNVTRLCIQLAPFLVAVGVLFGFDDLRARVLVLLLAGLITAGHALSDTIRQWLDAVFFTSPVREERAAGRAYVEALANRPAGPNPELSTTKTFDDAVRRALTALSDPTKLITSPLLNLLVVAIGVAEQGLEDNRINRAAVLKDLLLALLDGLRPGTEARSVTSDSQRFYNCLYYPYVHGISRRRAPTILRQLRERRERDGSARSDLEQVTEWLLHLDEGTFYKWQRRGSDTIAAVLREREAACGGIVPGDVLTSLVLDVSRLPV